MLFLSLYKRLPWCLKCCAFINLGEINALTLSTILSRIKPIQQYGRLKLVTMDMEKFYRTFPVQCTANPTDNLIGSIRPVQPTVKNWLNIPETVNR